MPALTWIRDALVVPCSGRPRERLRWFLDGGVYDADGLFVESCRHLGEAATHAAPPTMQHDASPVVAGRFLFGGWLQRHFGHLIKTLGRLWPLRDLAGQIDGVVFLHLPDGTFDRKDDSPHKAAIVADMLACFGIHPRGTALRIVAESTRFEHLAMPEQILFGAPETSAEGNAAFLAMLRGMRDSPRVPDGLVLPRLYVSRRRLPATLGGYLFEDVLEENLAAEGYAIMYPERLPVPTQVAAYASARRIILAESSAIHLAIGQIDPQTPVAVIARRQPVAPSLQRDVQAAGLRRATTISAIRGAVVALEGGRMSAGAGFSALTDLDLALVRDRLTEGGFCRGEDWRLPSEAEIGERIAAAIAARRKRMPQRRVCYVSAQQFAAGTAIPDAPPLG